MHIKHLIRILLVYYIINIMLINTFNVISILNFNIHMLSQKNYNMQNLEECSNTLSYTS